VIIKEETISVEEFSVENSLDIQGNKEFFRDAIFFDLEHYVYKKPVCIGVFGAAYYDTDTNELKATQYMLENKYELKNLLNMSKNYFEQMKKKYNKKYIVTFSGNNDFIVINYLLNKHNIGYKISENFTQIDLQKKYEQDIGSSIGLKNLEGIFGIARESELISGSNLAKTFGKIMKDEDYFSRMPIEKKEKILLYNMQDVVSLFYIYVNWKKYVVKPNINEKNNEGEVEDSTVKDNFN
jgi:uncharacterized protein YprB with RNaseH-like and TPR domain